MAFGRYRPKTLTNGYFDQKWPNFDHFGHFGGQKFFDQNNFWWSSKSYGDTTSCKNLEKIKTQYDWLLGKSQNSKKFSAKFRQNPTTSLKYPQGSQQLLGVKITSKINSAPSIYSVCRYSAKNNNF